MQATVVLNRECFDDNTACHCISTCLYKSELKQQRTNNIQYMMLLKSFMGLVSVENTVLCSHKFLTLAFRFTANRLLA
jgi:hypothetical protein